MKVKHKKNNATKDEMSFVKKNCTKKCEYVLIYIKVSRKRGLICIQQVYGLCRTFFIWNMHHGKSLNIKREERKMTA